ncbi:hypothetical protein ZWY2020_016955 [Hordeum vulgare]|nr:hypothetical protein ZWY2020_016955 [Hordeum vulgare]
MLPPKVIPSPPRSAGSSSSSTPSLDYATTLKAGAFGGGESSSAVGGSKAVAWATLWRRRRGRCLTGYPFYPKMVSRQRMVKEQGPVDKEKNLWAQQSLHLSTRRLATGGGGRQQQAEALGISFSWHPFPRSPASTQSQATRDGRRPSAADGDSRLSSSLPQVTAAPLACGLPLPKSPASSPCSIGSRLLLPATSSASTPTMSNQKPSQAKSARTMAPLSPRKVLENLTLVDADALDCGVCYLPLKPSIFQCMVGHVLCSQCRDKLASARAAVCRAPMDGGYRRNHAMEAGGVHPGTMPERPYRARWPCTTDVRAEESFHVELRKGFNVVDVIDLRRHKASVPGNGAA